MSSRGGLYFILQYIEKSNLLSLVENNLKSIKFNRKSKGLVFVFRQILIYFIDGSSKAISGFDSRKKDPGYAATLELSQEELVSSHIVKRFFRKFTFVQSLLWRKVLNELFIWRLHITKPSIIFIDIDTMVLDNDSAKKRSGCEPTYKKKKGFQPLQMGWNNVIIDALFRRGKSHSNHGNDVQNSTSRMVQLIRKKYSQTVPIVFTTDSGFLDQKIFSHFEKWRVFYICFGKLYKSVKQTVEAREEPLNVYDNGKNAWGFTEFRSRLDSWNMIGSLRTIFTTLLHNDSTECTIDFTKPDSILYTNIGIDEELTKQLCESGNEKYLKTEEIIELAHSRGALELNHRSLKDLMTSESLPFKRFGMNSVYYYIMLIAHFIFETYKEDMEENIKEISSTMYPTTFRRVAIDFAVKFCKTGGKIILKVTEHIAKSLQIPLLWKQCKMISPIEVW